MMLFTSDGVGQGSARIFGRWSALLEQAPMRKIAAGLAISLDGVVESPSNWMLFNDEKWEVIGAGIAQSDAILLGRRTYLEFAALVWYIVYGKELA